MPICEVTRPPASVDLAEAPSVVPNPVLDLEQLGRLALGEPKTTNEILRLFDLEIDILLARIGSEEPRSAAARAHTLAVSAKAVGAWDLAAAATAFEHLAQAPEPVALGAATRDLSRSATAVQMEIESLLSEPMKILAS
jgi:HPt (histidine-containing phosphotransfer) domain-containing protein